MKNLKKLFIKLAIKHDVLKFGEFELKSGRISPYFFNAGLFYTADALNQIGQIFCKILIDNQIIFEHLFGPAYKGISLVTSTACALAHEGIQTTVTFNRKETKDHGEKGLLIGAPLFGPTVMIDDVITAGTAFLEARKQITAHQGDLVAVLIMLDRCERGEHNESSTQMIQNQGIAVHSIINLHDLIDFLKEEGATKELAAIRVYQERYGCV